MAPVDGDNPVFLAIALDDRDRPRLDDEEVARGIPGGEQRLAPLDPAKASQLAQPRELILVEPREGAIALRGLGEPRADGLIVAVHAPSMPGVEVRRVPAPA
jgi:hypothetical protein